MTETNKIMEYINKDINKCRIYIDRINNGDYACAEEAFEFTIRKHNELMITDSDIVTLKKMISKTNPINQDIITTTIGNLRYIIELLEAKAIKEQCK